VVPWCFLRPLGKASPSLVRCKYYETSILLVGTAGWIRTTDLLIHSLVQAISGKFLARNDLLLFFTPKSAKALRYFLDNTRQIWTTPYLSDTGF